MVANSYWLFIEAPMPMIMVRCGEFWWNHGMTTESIKNVEDSSSNIDLSA